MSRFQKGLLALVIAFVAVIAIGYAGIRYLENSVVEAIRSWAASTTEDFHVTFGDIRYSFKDNVLFLDKSHIEWTAEEEKNSIDIDTLEIQGIGDSFIALLKDSKTPIKDKEILVADAIIARGIDTQTTIKIPMDTESASPASTFSTNTHVAQRTLSDIRMDTEKGKNLFSSSKEDLTLNLIYAIYYSKGEVSDLTFTIENDQYPVVVTAKNYTETNIGYGKAESMVFNDMTTSVKDMKIMSLDSILFKDINFPSMPVLLKIMEMGEQPEIASEEEALKLLKDLFLSTGKPLCGEFSINGMKITSPGIDISLASFRIRNPQVDPFTLDISMEHLVLPLALDPQLQTLRLAGFENMDLTATLSFTSPDASGIFKTSSSLNLAQGGTLDALFEGLIPNAEWDKFNRNNSLIEENTSDTLATFLLENLKIVNMEMGYADEGLLPRGIRLAQISMGLSPEQSLDLLRQQVILMALDLGEQIPDAADKMNSFIDYPGAIRLSIKPKTPVGLEQLENNPDIPVSLDVTPGPKSVEELVKALN